MTSYDHKRTTSDIHQFYALPLFVIMVQDYNFRSYSVRRVREEFRKNQHLQNQEEIEKAMQQGKQQLPMLQRQAEINVMYGKDERVSAIEAWQIAKREAGVKADHDHAH